MLKQRLMLNGDLKDSLSRLRLSRILYIGKFLLLSIQRMTKKRTKVYNVRAEKLSHWFNLYLVLSVAIS